MKNWKTTVSGIIAAAGLAMQASNDSIVKVIGLILAALGTAMIGGSAKDNNVTGGTKPQ